MYKILIVEDDRVIGEEVTKHLMKWGYEVHQVKDFTQVTEEFLVIGPHLVLMDIGLPFFNGYYWCTEIRKKSKVPIIFLSSASDSMNIVMAMNMGADDFITKPFELEVLAAKVQAMLRRTYDFIEECTELEHRGVILNLADATLVLGNDKIKLTKNEFLMLQILFEHKGKVVAREEIMKKLWDTDYFIDDNTLTVNMGRVRKKLEEMGLRDFITTKKGLGYILENE
ncbi:DNA-binding response regulator [Sporanaerobium hydrogeniformans]|uniref:DNA-binding response regulator n=1 Tax=Sporanaerobium hydrogeniformans TaxID=3072179 RepID=A0AC61D8M7_9FIRM|nr:response regulator transcription factor [Sporanaerobium hydrogeniformans]PHV69759.1 DNA-binding response regulator [Sporanaerobium hydrogeniformans]